MPDNVIEGPWKSSMDYDGTVCSCGEAWFRLWLPDEDPVGVAVVLDKDGHITGYRGFPRCISCGAIRS